MSVAFADAEAQWPESSSHAALLWATSTPICFHERTWDARLAFQEQHCEDGVQRATPEDGVSSAADGDGISIATGEDGRYFKE